MRRDAPATHALLPDSAKPQVVFEDGAELGDINVALATDQHEIVIEAEVAVPFLYLIIGPGLVVLREVLIRKSREVRAQADVSFVHRRAGRQVLVVRGGCICWHVMSPS